MRRLVSFGLMLLVAAAAAAATPYYLDREGVLWKADATPSGLVLTGEHDGQQVVSSTVPFAVGIAGSSDEAIQVAADEVTGKVVVVWQRNWGGTSSEIIAAVWAGDTWEQILHLTGDVSLNPRSPAIRISQVSTTEPDPNDPSNTITIRDSFLHLLWWEGSGDTQHAMYALLRLTASPDDADRLLVKNLDEFARVGLSCASPPPASVVEHPLFASQASRDRAVLFFATSQSCLFHLVEVTFEFQDPPTQDDGGLVANDQRRRARPIFGERRVLPSPHGISLQGARVLLGSDLSPVAYQVRNDHLEYVVATDTGWSEVRTLPVSDGLTIDQAIPLVENLAR
jgi:hypothetical protein